MGNNSVNFNEPVKCPDCKVWWRGQTHKCEPQQLEFDYGTSYPKKPDYKKPNGYSPKDICIKCRLPRKGGEDHTCHHGNFYKEKKKGLGDHDAPSW